MKTIAEGLEEKINQLKAEPELNGFARCWLKELEGMLADEPRAQAEFARQLYGAHLRSRGLPHVHRDEAGNRLPGFDLTLHSLPAQRSPHPDASRNSS